jgi:FkbM family methyltransferase
MSARRVTLRSALAWLRAPRAEQVVLRGVPIRFAVIDGDSGDQLRAGYESEVLDFIDTLPPDAVLYDLGASIGHFSLYAAARGLTTLAFEPDPANYAALEANARANRSPNLTTLSIAISDRRDDEAVLRSNSAKQRVGDHHKVLAGPEFSGHEVIGSSLDTAVNVKAMPFDTAIDELRLPRPSALKVDIDGSELAFVRGAEQTLRDGRLQSIMIELWQGSSHYDSVVRELESAGFHRIAEHQVYSSIGIEEGLYNIRFERTIASADE